MDSDWVGVGADSFAAIGTVGAFIVGFTLLRRDYRIWADEEGTQLCPRTVCRQKRARLLYLLHGRREQRFAAALSQIGASSKDKRPPLWFLHVLLPHEPLRFLPSGKVYEGPADPEPGLDGNESFDNGFLAQQAEQRHLLQLEYTDTLVRKLRGKITIWDRADGKEGCVFVLDLPGHLLGPTGGHHPPAEAAAGGDRTHQRAQVPHPVSVEEAT